MSLPSSWQELIMLFGTVQGLVLVIALSTNKIKRKSPANALLIWFVLSLVFLMFTGAPAKADFMKLVQRRMGYIGDTVAYLYGPLLFLYTSRLLFHRSKREWLHFIPAMIFFPANIAVQWIGMAELGEAFQRNFFIVFGIIAFVQFYAYIIVSFRMVRNYKSRITRELSYTPPVDYLLTIIGFIGFCLCFFLIDFVRTVMGLQVPFGFIDYELAWTLISLLTFILAYYAIISPEIFRLNPVPRSTNTIDLLELQEIKRKLLTKMENQKLYLDPDLSLTTVADRLNIRKELLSKTINQGLSKNFYRFVNEYRIEEFKRLVEDENNKHITHLGLAIEAGFKSKTTFYKAFRELTGTTPTQYLKVS